MQIKCFKLALMGVLIVSLLGGCTSEPKDTKVQVSQQKTQEDKISKEGYTQIVDGAGRTVEIPIPEKLERIYPISPVGLIVVYTLAPKKLAGVPLNLSEHEKKYLSKDIAELKNLGSLAGGGKLNYEAIIDADVQVLISCTVEAVEPKDVEYADQLQQQLGIPVVVVNGAMEEVSDTYELLGKITGEEEKAKVLGAYCNNVLKDVKEKVSKIKPEDRIKIYYAEGKEGLETEPAESSHADVLNYANALNVADIEVGSNIGRAPVSLEQVIGWNPELIISWGDDRGGAYSKILGDPAWKSIQAVSDKEVYAMPNSPFSWMDRPPSINRFLGVQWVAHLLYPDIYDIDIIKVSREFYDLFYHIQLSDEEMKELLEPSIRK